MINVCVIGAGASGLAAAITAARRGGKVTVLERENKPLKKVARTGNGKCNITNYNIDSDSYRSHDKSLAYETLSEENIKNSLKFLKSLGIFLVDKDGYAYPASGSAQSVVKLLLLEAQSLGIKIKTNENAKAIEKTEKGYKVVTEGWAYEADKVIIASGTNAGLEDDMTPLAKVAANEMDIKFYDFIPALTKLYGKDKACKEWAGVRTKAKVSLFDKDSLICEDIGEIQLVNTGISGIPVFQISRFANEIIKEGRQPKINIDFFPDLNEDDFVKLLSEIKSCSKNKTIKECLAGVIPEKLIAALINDKMSASEAVGILKKYEFICTAPSKVLESQVCAGGIALNSVTDSFEIKNYPGIFVTGEALDVDGKCGGYNLLWAWTTGIIAGKSAVGE